MPNDTDLYVLNHTEGYHGVNDEEDRWTIFIHGEIDTEKHKKLLNRSIYLYGDYGIWNDEA